MLETAGREWAAERVHSGVRSLSNEPTIRTAQTRSSADLEGYARARGWAPGEDGAPSASLRTGFDFALAYGDHETYARQGAHLRRMRAQALLERERGAIDVAAMMGFLRDHYEGTFLGGPQFHPFLPDVHTLCMHASPAGFTWGNTATSVVVELAPDDPAPPTLWLCSLPPCTGIYAAYPFGAPLPEAVTEPGTAGLQVRAAPDAPPDRYQAGSLWWRFRRLVDAVCEEPAARRSEARAVFEPLEARRLERLAALASKRDSDAQRAFVLEQLRETEAALDRLEAHFGRRSGVLSGRD